jgi:hypothetical protein
MEVSCQLQFRRLYAQGKSPHYPLDRRLGGLQSRSGHGGNAGIVLHFIFSVLPTSFEQFVIFKAFMCFFGVAYEGVSKRFRIVRLERELQMVQLSASRCSCIAILWVSLVSFAAITLFVTS